MIGTTDRLGGAEKAFRTITAGLRSELGLKLKMFSHIKPKDPDPDFDVTALQSPDGSSLARMFLNLRSELLKVSGPAILFPFQINSNVLAVGVNRSLPNEKRLPVILNDRACIDEILAAGAAVSLSGRLQGPLRRRLALWAYRNGDHVVCNAQANERAMLRFTGLDSSRVSTIYNPLAAAEIQSRFPERDRRVFGNSEAPLLVVHARMDKQKGLDSLLRAFARVKEVHSGVRLRIVGDGPERPNLEALASELGVRSSCEFLGFLSDPLTAIESGDVYVLPSRWEGLPNSLLEAIALGLPVVATRCPTGPDEILLDGQVGRLVAVDDIEAMSQNILELLSDGSVRQHLGKKARERARDFSSHRNVSAYGALLTRLLEESR